MAALSQGLPSACPTYSFFGAGAELSGTPGNTSSRAPHELPQVFLLCGCPTESDQGHLCSLGIGTTHWCLVGSPLGTKLKTMVFPLREPITISQRLSPPRLLITQKSGWWSPDPLFHA